MQRHRFGLDERLHEVEANVDVSSALKSRFVVSGDANGGQVVHGNWRGDGQGELHDLEEMAKEHQVAAHLSH